MRLIDSHSHLYLEEFADDLPQVIQRARMAGVTHIFMPNIDSSTIEPMTKVCTQYEGYCFPMMGLHPTSVDAMYEKELETIFRHLEADNHYVAIGEIGIDLYWDKTYKAEQQTVFARQVEWALQYNLPIVVHCREAFDCIYKVLEPYKESPLRGIFHSFTGTADEALRMLEFSGFCIGINGVVTFKNSTLPSLLPQIPLERLVLETDSPYLTPAPNRGKRNESAYIKDTLNKVANVYGKPSAEIADITSANALKVFGISK